MNTFLIGIMPFPAWRRFKIYFLISEFFGVNQNRDGSSFKNFREVETPTLATTRTTMT